MTSVDKIPHDVPLMDYLPTAFENAQTTLRNALDTLYVQDEDKRGDLFPPVDERLRACWFLGKAARIDYLPTPVMSEAEGALGIISNP